MIELHTWKTPNGWKIAIMLEELGWDYKVHLVDFSKRAQFEPEFLAISPNNKVPAIVDTTAAGGPVSVFESGAILIYLAELSGQFLAPAGAKRASALEWLFWQVSGLAPALGQLGHYAVMSQEKIPSVIERCTQEVERVLNVLERRLATTPYLAGAEYTIADIATYPWMFAVTKMMASALKDSFAEKPAINAWLGRVGERPAVQRGMKIPS